MLLKNSKSLCHLSENDGVAFTELVGKYYLKVNSLVLRITHSEALTKEIVQDVFMKIWIKRGSLSSIGDVSSYLFTTARNQTLNVLKREALEKRARTIFGTEFYETREDNEDEIYLDKQRLLDRFVSQLPSQQRLVYILCYQKQLKHKEVALLLNISELTVKTHIHHALRAIKAYFNNSAYLTHL
jgi:RNA polymerase sigma-70 factor (ECF subfamily)